MPASPLSRMGGPSSSVAAFCPVPGVENRIAVSPPPCATVEWAPRMKAMPAPGSIV